MHKNEGGSIAIKINQKGEILDESGASRDWIGKKLDEVLGKGLADKIMEKEEGNLSGEGLKFGGEWADNLYDRQVPNIVKDLTGADIIKMDMELPIEKNKTIDISVKTTTQQGIKLTPEVKAKIKGKAPIIKTSGKMFEEKPSLIPKPKSKELFVDRLPAEIRGENFIIKSTPKTTGLKPETRIKREIERSKRDAIVRETKIKERNIKNDINKIKEVEREKAQQIIKEIKENKNTQLKQYKTDLKERQQKAIELLDKLPSQLQGRMKQAIADTTTNIRLANLEIRIADRIKKYQHQQTLKEAKNSARVARTAKITTEYQRAIREILDTYDLQKPTQKTITKLTNLRKFLQNNPEAPIPQKYLDNIQRLEKKPIRNMTTDEVKELTDTVKHLTKLGEEIQKHRIIVDKLMFNKELGNALKDTNNLDSKYENINRAMEVSNGFEFTFRVADKSDGSQMYEGWHAKTVKELGQKVNTADINQANRIYDFQQKHLEISNKTLSKREQKEVAAHLWNDQGGKEQTNKILKDLGLKELPKLTEKQEGIKEILKELVGEKTDKIQVLWETTMVDSDGRPMEFGIEKNYFPFYYEERGSDLGIYSILQDYRVQSKIAFGSGLERQSGVKLTPRTDIYKMAQEAVAKQELFLNLQPTLLKKGTIFRTKEYQNKAGKINTKYWVGYVDEMSRNGMSSNAVRTPMDGWLRKGRQNLSRGLLDLSFTSTAIQPLAMFDAMAYMITYLPKKTVFKLATNMVQSFVRPNFAKKTIEQSLALKTRKGGEEVISTFSENKLNKGVKIPRTTIEKIISKIRSPFAAIQFFDIRTAAAVQKTLVDELSKVMPKEQAQAEADFIMDLVSGSSNLAYRPRIMSQGELGRTLTTFQTFVLNEWGLATQDILKKGIVMGGKNRKMATRLFAVIGLGFLFLLAYLEDKLRNKITNATKGTDYESDPFWKTALLYLPERIPVLGNIVSGVKYGKAGLSVPLVDTFSNIITETSKAITSKKKETRLIALSKSIESFAILFLGLPGVKEAQNILERKLKSQKSIGSSDLNLGLDMGLETDLNLDLGLDL
jgi:hypothetical protein